MIQGFAERLHDFPLSRIQKKGGLYEHGLHIRLICPNIYQLYSTSTVRKFQNI